MVIPVKEKKSKGSSTNPENKVKVAFYLPRKSAEDLEEVRFELIKQGKSRRDASQSNLVAEAIELLKNKYLGK
ncbi:MAG: hypothetical protein PHE84_04280 [bacterium]|nr:hypothetical protein [bacterium]